MTPEQRRRYLKWKRANVTYRGMREIGQENGGGAKLGEGLYSACLSNRSMARHYGDVRFAVNAAPKRPYKARDINSWEIFEQGLVDKFCAAAGVERDVRYFNARTSVKKELMKLGYDGVVIPGREMVNYIPDMDKVKYYRTETEVEDHWRYYVLDQQAESRFDEYMEAASV